MNGWDDATWQALGLMLTLLGLLLSAVAWRRRGAASGLRAVAWSLLPLAAGLTGVLRLAADIAGSVSRWAVRLAFSPVVWLGVAVAATSVVLFVVSGFLLRRRGSRTTLPAGASRRAVGPQARPAAPAAGRGTEGTGGMGGAGGMGGIAGMEDVEEILRRRGIS